MHLRSTCCNGPVAACCGERVVQMYVASVVALCWELLTAGTCLLNASPARCLVRSSHVESARGVCADVKNRFAPVIHYGAYMLVASIRLVYWRTRALKC